MNYKSSLFTYLEVDNSKSQATEALLVEQLLKQTRNWVLGFFLSQLAQTCSYFKAP